MGWEGIPVGGRGGWWEGGGFQVEWGGVGCVCEWGVGRGEVCVWGGRLLRGARCVWEARDAWGWVGGL